MATIHHNLSDYDPDTVPSAAEMRVGVIISEWNAEITEALAKGAIDTLLRHGAKADNLLIKHVPGSFELPLGAQMMLESGRVDGVICLGSVIRGETSHFDYVCEAVSSGVKEVSLNYNRPVIFGVLTDDNIEQSRARSGGKHGNKGDEAAVAVIKMLALQRELGPQDSPLEME